jgi:hypothetical protein
MVTSDAQRALLDSPGLYLTGEDNLRLTTIGAVAGVTIVMEGRLVTMDGRVVPLAERHTPNSNYTAATSIFGLAEGTLTNVQLRASSAGLLGGGVWCVLEIVRGGGSNAQALGTLLQGYATTNGRLAWPGSLILPATFGAGRLRSITGTDPAANNEISETVPTGVRWRLLSFYFTLVTDANVANRNVRLVIDDGTNTFLRVGSNQNHGATTTAAYIAAELGFTGSVSFEPFVIPLPTGIWLSPGSRIRTNTGLMQVGDNYSAPQYSVEEFIE